MDILKHPAVTYIGMFIAVIAIVDGAVDIISWLSPDVAWGIASIAGFGSIASLRAYLEVKGWKTYVASGIPIVINIFMLLGVVDAATAEALSLAFAPLIAATLQQTASKMAVSEG